MRLVELLLIQASLYRAQRIVCYVNGWAQYRPLPATFQPGQVDPFLCTHLVYAHAQIQANQLQPAVQDDLKKYKDVQRLKNNNPQLKTMLSVGGWDMESVTFSALVNDSSAMRDFSQSATRFLRLHGFDGLDIDWRFPTERGSRKEDSGRLSELLKNIRVAFEQESTYSGKSKLILSTVVGSTKAAIDYGYQVPELAKLADFLNVLSVDLGESWGVAAHPSPLQLSEQEARPDTSRQSLSWTADYWRNKVPDPAVLNLGLSFHAQTFLLTSPNNNSFGAPVSGPGKAGSYTFTKGRLAYFEVCLLQALGAPRRYSATQQVPYLVQGDLWVGYEDHDSLTAKLRFLQETGVGGVAVWHIDEDDFGGTFCHLGNYPLLQLVFQELARKQTKAQDATQDVYNSPDASRAAEERDVDCGRVVCYISNRGALRSGSATFMPSQVKADLCTHFLYAHARLEGTHLVPQIARDAEMYKLMIQIRERWNPSAAVMLSVGGWEMGSAPFTRLVASTPAVKVFARQAAVFLRDSGFDGLDIDWQFPTRRGSPLVDRQHFTNFLRELRTAFNGTSRPGKQPALLLSVTLSARQDVLTYAYELSKLHLYVNFINFMTFDQHGAWEEMKEHHSPLFSPFPPLVNGRSLSASKATEIVTKSGIPMRTVNFGVSFFARSYTVFNKTDFVISGRAGNHTGQKGFLAYFEVCELLRQGAATRWMSDQLVPFLSFGDQWVAFDNQRSINEKVRYAMSSGYGGMAVWTVDVDDFSGQFCQRGPFPLLQTLISSCRRYRVSLRSTPVPPPTPTPTDCGGRRCCVSHGLLTKTIQ